MFGVWKKSLACCLDFRAVVEQLWTLGGIAAHVVMITKYNHKSLAFGIPGILLQMIWIALVIALALKNGSHNKALPEWVATLFGFSIFLGTILWIVGLCYYAMAKGHNAIFGLLGIFSWIGLLILFVLPDKAKGQEHNATYTAPETN